LADARGPNTERASEHLLLVPVAVADERTPAHPWTSRSMAHRGVSERCMCTALSGCLCTALYATVRPRSRRSTHARTPSTRPSHGVLGVPVPRRLGGFLGKSTVRPASQCLAYALAQPELDDQGVWGGTSLQQRRDARRRGLDSEAMIAELGGDC
jgi:hypothetical protein